MPEITPSRYVVNAGWSDIPHLDDKTQRELLSGTPPYLRDSRSKGIPALGVGAIYPIPWDEVSCEPFVIPSYWKKAFGFDVGWKTTAAIWLAEDPNSHHLYAFVDYYRGKQLPSVHAAAIKARGAWIPGAIDPASRGSSQEDGKKLLATYRALGLKIKPANNAVEYGLQMVWGLLETGQLQFFRTLQNTANEYNQYRRERKVTDLADKVTVVKKNDHLMDALRYAVVEFQNIAIVKPAGVTDELSGTFTPVDKRAGY